MAAALHASVAVVVIALHRWAVERPGWRRYLQATLGHSWATAPRDDYRLLAAVAILGLTVSAGQTVFR